FNRQRLVHVPKRTTYSTHHRCILGVCPYQASAPGATTKINFAQCPGRGGHRITDDGYNRTHALAVRIDWCAPAFRPGLVGYGLASFTLLTTQKTISNWSNSTRKLPFKKISARHGYPRSAGCTRLGRRHRAG